MHTHKEKEFPKVISLIQKSIETYKKDYRVILGVSLIPLIFSILSVTFDALSKAIKGVNIGIEMLVVAISIVITILASITQLSMQIGILSYLKHKRGDIKHVMEHGLKLFLPAILITLLIAVIILGAIPLLFLPAIIASFVFSFSIISLAQDGKRNLSALGQSLYMVEGRVVKVIWNYLILGFIVVLASLLCIFFSIGVFIMPYGETLSMFLWMIIQHLFIMPVSLIYAHYFAGFLRDTKSEFLPEIEMVYRRKVKNYLYIAVGIIVIVAVSALVII